MASAEARFPRGGWLRVLRANSGGLWVGAFGLRVDKIVLWIGLSYVGDGPQEDPAELSYFLSQDRASFESCYAQS